jgi:PAS domain S-box-containing protein
MPNQSSAISWQARALDVYSPEVFRLLVDSVSDYAIFVLDPDGIIVSWNIGAKWLHGYDGHEIIGKHVSVLYTPSDLATDKTKHELETAARAGHFEDEGWRLRKDGSHFWADVVTTRILSEDGKLLGFGNITRDLTAQRQAEHRYKLLVEGVLDYAIFSMDPKGCITSWNIGAERIKGYTAEEIIGKRFSVFYTPEDQRARLPDHVLHTAATEGHFEGEGWRVRKDGTRFWASVVVTALRDQDGSLYGFSKVTRDVSERKAMLDKLAQHSQELELRIQEREQSNAELEAFAYSVSHDLRAPLRAISGFADALREDYDSRLDQQGRQYIAEISSAAARMNSLVQDLLDYGRIGRISMPLETVKLLQATENAIRETSDGANLIQLDVPANLAVKAHPQLLTQLIFNLLSNALKFHKPNVTPEVKVKAELQGSFVRFSVADNGIGIAPQHQDRIWQVFERLHDRDTYPGTGIGLAIVKRITMRMHGAGGVESELGKGSEFWVKLPLAAETQQDTTKEETEEEEEKNA